METEARKEDSEGEESAGEEEEEGVVMATQLNQFFSELHAEESKSKKRLFVEGGFKVPRRKSGLPQHLYSVMGSANLRLARGDSAGAIALCKEVIRQAPHAVEPYFTLATIYEELEDEVQSLKVLLIATHLKRSDQDLWVKCACLAKKQGNFPLAEKCFSKALVLDPNNIDLIWEKSCAFSDMRDHRKVVDCLEHVLRLVLDPTSPSPLPSQILPETSGRRVVEVTKELARAHHALNETSLAVEKLEDVLEKYPDLTDPGLINILAELCLSIQKYDRVYDAITNFYGMVPELPAEGERRSADPLATSSFGITSDYMADLTRALRLSISGDNIEVDLSAAKEDTTPTTDSAMSSCDMTIPGDMPVDLRTKLAVAMINTGKEVSEKLLEPVFSSPEDNGDLFLDLIDVYYTNAQYPKALPLLSALVCTDRYSQAGVWLKHAECLHMLGDLEGAVISYSKVLSLASHHIDTRLQLATLYYQLGNPDDAIAVLEADPSGMEEEEAVDLHSGGETSTAIVSTPVKQPKAISKKAKTSRPELQDIRIAMHKYKLFLSTNKTEDSLKTGEVLLGFFFREVHDHPIVAECIKQKMKKKKFTRHSLGPEASKDAREVESHFSWEEWLDVFKNTCKGLLKMDLPSSYDRVTNLIYCAVINSKFSGPLELMSMAGDNVRTEMKKQIRRIHSIFCQPCLCFCASVSYIMGDYSTALLVLRDICISEPTNKHIWNIINLIPLDDPGKKLLLRVCHKVHNTGKLAQVSLANLYHTSERTVAHPTAIALYEKVFHEGGCKDYLLSLCIGVLYLNLASPSKNPQNRNRNGLILMGAGFLHTYVKLRGVCQESMYNMGRAFHQIGLPHLACHFYKKVLVLDPECRDPELSEMSDLRGEAAYNLSLIYRASGNHVLARNLLQMYCSV